MPKILKKDTTLLVPKKRCSNASHDSLRILKMKIDHHLKEENKGLVLPERPLWEDLRILNPWIAPLEEDIKTIFNVHSIPHLDVYAGQLIDQYKK